MVATAMSKRPLRDRKTNFSHSSTNHKNLVKIGTVDAEIIGLTKIVKNKNRGRTEARLWLGGLISGRSKDSTFTPKNVRISAV